MNLSLSSEQLTFQDAVGRYGAAVKQSSAVATWRKRWSEIAELGWLGCGLSLEAGGFGGGPVEVMIAMQGAGEAMMRTPLLETIAISARLFSLAGAHDLLEKVIAGESVVVPAFIPLQEKLPSLRANGQGSYLDGECMLVPFGDRSDGFLVLARSSGDVAGRALVYVDAAVANLNITGSDTIDGRRVATLRFDKVQVMPEAVIARGEDTDRLVADVIDHATGAICAEALGVATMLHQRTLDYAKQRVQFGQPIGRFQAIQHRLADMFIAIEEAKSLTVMATTALGQPAGPARSVSLAAAKVGVMARTLHIAREAIQLHGGVGFTSELPLGDGLKRLKVLNVLLGDEDYHLSIMTDAQQGEPTR